MQEQKSSIDDMSPLKVFVSGDSFGELALIHGKGRNGTVVTLTDCYFAVINAESYTRLLAKDAAQKMAPNVKFLR